MTTSEPNSLPLDGITVVSMEQAVAAPFATRQLADLGARVIKIERAEGDFARNYDETVNGMASYFVWLNRGKESVVLDLKSEQGKEVMRELMKEADVLVQNLAPGAAERLGLGAEALQEINPQLIHVSISGYGMGGSYTKRKAYDLLIQCESGLLSVTGTPEAPAKVGVSVADISAGMYAYSGILAALIQRGKTGKGQVLDISMLESLGEWVQQTYFFAEYGGKAPRRAGASHASIAPYGPFQTLEGTVFLGIQNEREWQLFCDQVIERPDMAQDPRFTPNARRVENREELDDIIAETTSTLSTKELQARLDAVGIANAQLRDMHGFSAHPQLAERNRWRDVETPAGPVRSMMPPATLEGTEPAMKPVPALGEHTDAVIKEFLGQA
ncbi:CaiB/BaiF CoA transferase family protein [Kocuria carniphila]|uniref:CaiB/BaiF CoA transferase family protein n=1 Tax=Kocuria carniphila TaxID=262208 RepID=UPI0034CD1771